MQILPLNQPFDFTPYKSCSILYYLFWNAAIFFRYANQKCFQNNISV